LADSSTNTPEQHDGRVYAPHAGAGEREAVEFADTLATVFEVLLVVGALVLARTAPARAHRWPAGALGVSALVALIVAGLTAASLMALAEL
jgi:hypothetical protein